MIKYFLFALRLISVNIILSACFLSLAPGTVFSEQGRFLNLASAEKDASSVTCVEDLMREHGLLRRILLIYDKESTCYIEGKELDYNAILKSAAVIKDFIENYHEKLEEDYIFPVFRKTGELSSLAHILQTQHQASRRLTLLIIQLAKEKHQMTKAEQDALIDAMRSFVKMYRVHAAREDTVLFSALHKVVSEKEYNSLGDKFDDIEHRMFGEDGFEAKLREVSEIERKLNIYNLSQFTP